MSLLEMLLVARSNMLLVKKENQAQYNRAKQHNNPYESTVCLLLYSCCLQTPAISYAGCPRDLVHCQFFM